MRFLRVLFCTFVTVLFSTGGISSAWSDTARGLVFEDRNGNGVHDAGEPGIAGVRISNGVDVVVTGRDGGYRIGVDDPGLVFVSKPSGYATPVNSHQLPQFYYLHQPDGSPAGLRYQGVSPTGALPDSIDFPLMKRPEPARFEAILFADTQPQSAAEIDFIRETVVPELIGSEAAFGMTMGDILFDDMSLFPRFNAVIAQIGIPWYNVPGNHELNLRAQDDATSLETFKRFYGPPYYSFEYGDALFVVLDNIEYQGFKAGDGLLPGQQGKYVAKIAEEQLRWLEAELSHVPRDTLVFIAMHSPLRTYSGEPERPGANTVNRRALFKLLEGRPNLYAVAGHTHTTEHHYFGREDGFEGPGEFHHHVLAAVSGSWWSGPLDSAGRPVSDLRDGAPKGYHILEVDGTDALVRYKGVGHPADHQMRILFEKTHFGHSKDIYRDFRPGELFEGRMPEDAIASTRVVVNLFDGGPKSQVSMRIGDGEFRPMQRVMKPDPYIVESFARNRAQIKSWVQPIPSSHLFEAALPRDLAPGTWTVSVRAFDEFGRAHHAHRVLEITGSSATVH